MSELKSHEFRDVTVNITMSEYEELFNAKKKIDLLIDYLPRLFINDNSNMNREINGEMVAMVKYNFERIMDNSNLSKNKDIKKLIEENNQLKNKLEQIKNLI